MRNEHLRKLKSELASSDGLLRPALLIAQAAYPELAVESYVSRIDTWAEALLTRAPRQGDLGATLGLLNHYLFEELEFKGNTDEFYDPRNSYLNEVLDRKLGIPITLSIIYIELGQRLGLALHGVAFPGHFLVKLKTGEGDLALDPFNRGQMLGTPALRRRLSDLYSTDVEDPSPFLASASRKDILVRMLGNLKAIYRTRGEMENVLRSSDQIIVVDPQRAEEYRDRGLVRLELDCPHTAITDFSEYLKRRPNAPDSGSIREQMMELRSEHGRLN
jgi:regulator of sirC expression with transglutaminase-like and TPR domain